ncbi:unnamed protein product [Lupinus luteus]|uniref:Acyl-CoA N-acyltransferase n=1 Tax=Lupinus luteus TaxID=3873 RepID=A0AAV1X434_LUPLU
MQVRINVPLHSNIPISQCFSLSSSTSISAHFNSISLPIQNKRKFPSLTAKINNNEQLILPTMSDIIGASRAQKLDLKLQIFGPFFRITAKSLETEREVGKAEGLIRVWVGGRILHLDSIRLRRETLGMEKSIFGLGLFIGAVAIRHGYDCGCVTAQLLAINDSDLYHSKLVRFYTRLGFKPVYEVTGSSVEDVAHMLVWGGVGTRMDASVEQLMIKWCTRFRKSSQ